MGIFCLIVSSGGVHAQRGFLDRSHGYTIDHLAQRKQLVDIARSQLGVREATGRNDGAAVARYLKVTGLGVGHAWCAAFVSWVYFSAGYNQPRTAWAAALFPKARESLQPKPADVLGIYSVKLKRIAHCGVVERRYNEWIISVEGNTNATGGREGDGVYRKWRHRRTIARFSDWVMPPAVDRSPFIMKPL